RSRPPGAKATAVTAPSFPSRTDGVFALWGGAHSFTVPSQPLEASTTPSAEQANAAIPPSWKLPRPMRERLSTVSHTCKAPMVVPAHRKLPSGDTTTASIPSLRKLLKFAVALWLDRSHTRTVQSALPEASRSPSGNHATQRTESLWP